MSRFLKLLGVDVRPYSEKVEGLDYIPWARALQLAGRPKHDVALFKQGGLDSTVRRLFGGGAVAIDMDIGNGDIQRIYLPILNMKGAPIPAGQENSRDVGDTIGRCAARAVAIIHGLGLSLYSLTRGDGSAYVEALQVAEGTADISKIEALRDVKEIKDKVTKRVIRTQDYLGWHAAVAAARITDPNFLWEVVEVDSVNPDTGQVESFPAMKLEGKGWMVGVRIRYKGQYHTQWLPIMGVQRVQTKNGEKPMEHQSLDTPSIFHWHSAVMRCLAKAIAISTGYGIGLYAKGDVDSLDDDEASVPVESEASSSSKPGNAPRNEAPAGHQQLVGSIKRLLTETESDEKMFVAWLSVPSLEDAPLEKLERGRAVLKQKLAAYQATQH